MATVDGASAIAWMQAKRTNEVGMCLGTVWEAYASAKTGQVGGSFPTAISAWDAAAEKYAGDRNPPAGSAVWFGASPTRTDANAGAGDVAISLGGGQIIATDYPYGGVIGVTTITAREKQTQRPYLGRTGDICGYSIILPATPTAPNTLEGDEDMTFHVLRQANGTTFILQKDLITYDPNPADQAIGNYLRGGQAPFGLNETDLLIALYRGAGISQTLAPWPTADKTATNILDSVLPGPENQFTRQVFDATGTPSLIKYN
jgi:hypothetical protein